MPTKNPHTFLPVISCLIAATLWGLLWYPLRLMEEMGVSGLWASALIYTATLIPLLPLLWRNRSGIKQQHWALLLIGITAGWANLGFILALLEGNVVRVLLLFYLSPIWTVLLGKFLLKEQVSIMAWLSIVMAMCGAGIMLWPPDTGIMLPGNAADILAITAGFAFAIMNVMIRKTGNIPIVLKMGPACLGVLSLSAIGIFVMQPPSPVLTTATLGFAMGIGGIGMLVMTYTAQYGVTHLPVHRSAVIFLFEIVAGAVSAALLTNEIVTLREWAGGLLVVLAAWITAMETLQPVVSSKKS
jgi:drug/metabolite transporter (DMT)-like permease